MPVETCPEPTRPDPPGDAASSSEAYLSRQCWSATRPQALVVVCSDGRLQKNIDDFLDNHLGIEYYDRMYVPGGPGALATSGHEFARADQFRRECAFLVQAHGSEEIILIFHGAADDGPEDATCADYRRKMSGYSSAAIKAQQEADVAEVVRVNFGWATRVRFRAYRAEVRKDGGVHFVDLMPR